MALRITHLLRNEHMWWGEQSSDCPSCDSPPAAAHICADTGEAAALLAETPEWRFHLVLF